MPKPSHLESHLIVDRRTQDRRTGEDNNYDGPERRQTVRRKIERRRQIDPTTCERDYNDDEIAFMKAMDEYKRYSGRQFPTWSEVLEVLRSLGYRKIAEPTPIRDIIQKAAEQE